MGLLNICVCYGRRPYDPIRFFLRPVYMMAILYAMNSKDFGCSTSPEQALNCIDLILLNNAYKN